MYKYFGWMFAFLTSLTLTAAYADDTTEERENTEAIEEDDQVTVVIDLDEITDDLEEEE